MSNEENFLQKISIQHNLILQSVSWSYKGFKINKFVHGLFTRPISQ
jgi:hypothetical protein